MPKAIIFDADGVIVDSDRFTDRLKKDFGTSPEVLQAFFGGPFQDCLIGKADLKEELAKVLHTWSWNKELDELLHYWFHEDANRVNEQFGPLIKELRNKGIVCVLGTNNEKYRTHDIVHKKGVGNWVDKVFSSAQLGVKKPDPEYFTKVCQELGLPPEEIMLWDDDPENIEAALNCGLQAKLYHSFEELKEHHE